jgi:hypothetical protein
MNLVEKSAAATVLASLMMAASSPARAPQALPVAGPANDTARFLAGMEPLADPALKDLTRNEAWQRHAKFFDTAWADLEKKQLSRIRDWATTNTPNAFSSKSTLFYMFSGPDFLYASTFFPQATTYVLCGIEPIGPNPDLSKLSPNVLGGELHALQSSLNSVLSFSFFITKEMKDDFKNHALSGTLPVLYIFLERSGMIISDVSYVSVDENGMLGPQPDPAHPKSTAPGVRISFVANGSSVQQTLYYFSTDISNDGLKHSGFLQFCKTLAPGDSFVKSASYLMHEREFSSIRDFLLDNTGTLIQDDSGIPCSFFAPELWNMTFFGSYPGPITLFKNYGQPMLAEYYKTTNPAPLDFGIGYRHHANESTLMVLSRKPQPAGNPSPSMTPLRALPVPEEAPQR